MGRNYDRITVNPDQMGGTPCLRGLRIPVATVVGMIADGMTEDEILGVCPDLERGDVSEALRFAAEAVRERTAPRSRVVRLLGGNMGWLIISMKNDWKRILRSSNGMKLDRFGIRVTEPLGAASALRIAGRLGSPSKLGTGQPVQADTLLRRLKG